MENKNVIIEDGDLFVVTRGFKYNNSPLFGGIVFSDLMTKTEEDRYDRSYDGVVFRAMVVCGPAIAAECVFAGKIRSSLLGTKVSFNTNELELWPVSQKYLDALVDSGKT